MATVRKRPKQSLRFGRITRVTETDEYAAIPWSQVECGLKRIWRFGHEIAEESQDRSRLSNRVVDVAGRDGANRMEATVKGCRDAKIRARAAKGPQQVRVALRIYRQPSGRPR